VGHGGGIAVSAGTVRLLEAAMEHPLESLERFAFSRSQVDESRRLLAPFIRLQLGKELRSAKFLDEVT
jgi:hypothetical protein